MLLGNSLDAVVQISDHEEWIHDLGAAQGGKPVSCLIPHFLSHFGLISLLAESSDGFAGLIRQPRSIERALIPRRICGRARSRILGECAGVKLGQVLLLGAEVDAGPGERVRHIVLNLLGRGL